jgi:hypothetical protein
MRRDECTRLAGTRQLSKGGVAATCRRTCCRPPIHPPSRTGAAGPLLWRRRSGSCGAGARRALSPGDLRLPARSPGARAAARCADLGQPWRGVRAAAASGGAANWGSAAARRGGAGGSVRGCQPLGEGGNGVKRQAPAGPLGRAGRQPSQPSEGRRDGSGRGMPAGLWGGWYAPRTAASAAAPRPQGRREWQRRQGTRKTPARCSANRCGA